MDWLRKSKIFRLVVELLSQGITPRQIALTLAIGSALGVFPLLGTTTLLCAVAAGVGRFNMPLIQLVNYLVYPLQLILLLPFWRVGAWLFGSAVPGSLSEMVRSFTKNPWQSLGQWGWTALEGIGVWGLASLAWVPLSYTLVWIVLNSFWKGKNSHV